MKKLLLLSSFALLTSQAMMAEGQPYILPGYFISDISSNGQYVVSSDYERLVIRDLTSDEEWVFVNGDGFNYSAGNGNCVSDNGIVVGTQTEMMDGSYFKDGEWHEIFSCSGFGMTTLNGITPDGSRICGSVGQSEFSGTNEDLMLVPVIINAEGDGFGDVVYLPHPETDFVGHVPQYVTALEISADGHTVIGMVTDYSGMMIYPIVYKEDSEGKWTYSLPTADLLNPNGLELPPLPGDGPIPPDPTDFMTEQEQEAYNEAYNEWVASGYTSTYPEYVDFMSMDEIEAYNAATEEYNAAAEIYNAELMAYYDVWDQIVAESTSFVFNMTPISYEGTKAVVSAEIGGGGPWEPGINYPVVLDLVNDTYTKYPNDNFQIMGTTITDDGYVLANEPLMTGIPNSYILRPGYSEFVPLYDYYLDAAPSVAAWMDEFMRHDIEEYDFETGETITTNKLVTGIAYGNRDLSTVVSAVQSVWESDEYVYSYVFPQMESGICDPVTDKAKDIKVSGRKGGMLDVTGEVASLQVFDLKGRLVFSVDSPAEVVNTRLSSGVYIAHAITAEGVARSFKLFF